MRRVGIIVLAALLWTVPAHAALMFATGTVQVTSGTANQQVIDANCISPRVVMVFFTRNTTNAAFAANQAVGIGVAVDRATDQQGSLTFLNMDNAATTDSARFKQTVFLRNIAATAGGFNWESSAVVTFAANGFTFSKPTNDGANLNWLHYVCLGGTEITNAWFGEFAITAGTGTKNFTGGTGVGFQGNLALFMGANTSTGGTNNSRIETFIGAANGTQQNVQYVYSQQGTTTNPSTSNAARSYMRNDRVIAFHDYGCCAGPVLMASFTQFTSDGFDLNVTDNGTGATRYILGLILQGTFQSHIGQQGRRSGTGTQPVTVTSGLTPKGLMVFGNFATANATEIMVNNWLMGAADANGSNGVWTGDESVLNTETNSYSSITSLYNQATGPSTLTSQAALSAFANGSYTLNFPTTNDTAQRLFWHVTLGDAVAAAPSRRPLGPILLP